ncbi:hypothetical protein [Dyadobacter flavalbus]|uniref:hypothetical protein n=1 Tax=Dyadobacter flavalbus TaxID=2579942 RepID=UPI001E45C5AB|nr:hypothetical protein [Dyadobacter flavalbus]
MIRLDAEHFWPLHILRLWLFACMTGKKASNLTQAGKRWEFWTIFVLRMKDVFFAVYLTELSYAYKQLDNNERENYFSNNQI